LNFGTQKSTPAKITRIQKESIRLAMQLTVRTSKLPYTIAIELTFENVYQLKELKAAGGEFFDVFFLEIF